MKREEGVGRTGERETKESMWLKTKKGQRERKNEMERYEE